MYRVVVGKGGQVINSGIDHIVKFMYISSRGIYQKCLDDPRVSNDCHATTLSRIGAEAWERRYEKRFSKETT